MMQRWMPMCYVSDTNDLVLNVKRTIIVNNVEKALLRADEINAACNATIIIHRMLRKGRLAFLFRQATQRRM